MKKFLLYFIVISFLIMSEYVEARGGRGGGGRSSSSSSRSSATRASRSTIVSRSSSSSYSSSRYSGGYYYFDTYYNLYVYIPGSNDLETAGTGAIIGIIIPFAAVGGFIFTLLFIVLISKCFNVSFGKACESICCCKCTTYLCVDKQK